jgi:Prion-inhibition and propagation
MGRRYHVLLTKLDVQRLCLTLWGESFGLLPEAGRSKDTRLDKANIQDTIEKVLLCIQALFQDAEDLTERYGPTNEEPKPKLKVYESRFRRHFCTLRRRDTGNTAASIGVESYPLGDSR